MKYIRLVCFWLAAIISFSLAAEHPIIYMVSTPRALSTAFTRMMYERGDCAIFHEPSQYAFDKIYYPQFLIKFFKPGGLETFEDVKNALFLEAKMRPVFAKEMSFGVEEFLQNDPEFIKNPQVQCLFLLRNPHHAAISFYKKCPDFDLKDIPTLLGYESLLHIIENVEIVTQKPPYIILTEDVYADPYSTVKAFCEETHIPFMPDSLTWEKLEASFDVEKEWHERKIEETWKFWHGDAIFSSGFGKPSQYALDENGNPTFEEIKNLEHREIVRKAYEYNLPFYNSILAKIPGKEEIR